MIDGFNLNYRVALAEEACFDTTQASHAINLYDMNAKYADVVPTSEVLAFFDSLPAGMFDLREGRNCRRAQRLTPDTTTKPLRESIMTNRIWDGTLTSRAMTRPCWRPRGSVRQQGLANAPLFFFLNLNAGFLTIQSHLNGEPLEEYIKPTGGGYFFVLPGAPDETAAPRPSLAFGA